MPRTAHAIVLSPEERETLNTWARGRARPHQQVLRAQIILMAARGDLNRDIAGALRISRPTVQTWRERFLKLGLSGIEKDAKRSGRKSSLTPAMIRSVIDTTLNEPPPAPAARWTVRGLARVKKINPSMVQRIWKRHLLPLRFTGSPSSGNINK